MNTYADILTVWAGYGLMRLSQSSGLESNIMTKFTFDLEGLFAVTKGPRGGAWEASYAIDLAAIPADIVPLLVRHGLKQKLADAASGATTEAEAFAAMAKAGDAILAGDWAVRTPGAGAVSDEQAALVNLIGAALSADKRKEYNGKPLVEKLAIAEKNVGKFTAEQVAAEVAKIVRKRDERALEKAANAQLAAAITIDF